MKRSNRLILLIGVFLAILAFVGIYVISTGGGGTPTPVPTTATTVVAAVDIPLGTEVTAEMIREEQVELTARATGVFESATLVAGQIARRNIAAGAQISTADFSTTSGSLQVKTPPGLRAMSIQVDQVSGVGTLINPGDYVDVIVACQFEVVSLDADTNQPQSLEGLESTSVKLIVSGIQVLGTLVPPPAAGAAPEPGATPPPALTGQQQIVIVAVSAQQTEVLNLGQKDCQITLVLRSPDDFKDEAGNPVVPPDPETSGMIMRTYIDEYGVLVPQLIEAILPAQQPPVQSPAP